MNDERTFDTDTPAECNRCGKVSPLPKPCQGHQESRDGNVYRLDAMCVLSCGHMDAHWVVLING